MTCRGRLHFGGVALSPMGRGQAPAQFETRREGLVEGLVLQTDETEQRFATVQACAK